MPLTDEQKRLLVLYHNYVRERGLTMCERVQGADGVVRHRQVRIGRGQDLIVGFEGYLERQEPPEQSEKEGVGG